MSASSAVILPQASPADSVAPNNKVSALEELAKRCGIQDSFVDVFGHEQKTSPEVTRSLFRAMRFEVESEGEAEAALAELDRKEWASALPPVLVAYLDRGPVSVSVALPSSSDTVRWTVSLEGGAEESGEVEFRGLPLLDAKEIDNQKLERRTLTLPIEVPAGYHRLRVRPSQPTQPESEMSLIVTPGRCWLPGNEDQQQRLWGVAANLYLLRSKHNWGIGDFSDLRAVVELAAERRADAVGINPVHAMFLDEPKDASPYSPSDRVLLNVLNIDVDAIPELAGCEPARRLMATSQFQARLEASRSADLVQYEAAAELKLSVLRLLFQSFEEQPDPQRLEQFEAFHAERRELLDRACLFQAMRAYFSSQNSSLSDCAEWPEKYRSSSSPAVSEFAERHARLVRFHRWLQWIADTQLKQASEAASGMTIGLYRDLAVGAHPSGAEVWSHPETLVSTAQVGAPPDILAPTGQNWGLPPLHPIAIREHAYSSFIDLLRANMRYAGGLRIDHAMALERLYWIPKGNESKDGAYVRYPTDDLVGIIALESQRNRCLVVGEDLGSVPEGFRERMAAANILSYRVLFFEKNKTEFLAPAEYPYLGLSVASNHDLPTLRGWWQESDVDLKERLDMYPDGPDAVRKEHAADRKILLEAFREEQLLSPEGDVDIEQYSDAAHRFLGRTKCLLTLVQLDDVTGEVNQVNLPGSTSEYPNWRRKLSASLEDLASDARLDRIAELMRDERKPELVKRGSAQQHAAPEISERQAS
jgi:4-alpha-glucanotransferase